MNTSQNKLMKSADRYLHGEMDAVERTAFEEQLETDADFRRRFEEHRLLVEGLQRYFFREQLEEYLNNSKESNEWTSGKVVRIIPLWKKVLPIAAAVLLLLGWVGWKVVLEQQREPEFGGGYHILMDRTLPVKEITLEEGSQLPSESRNLRLTIQQAQISSPIYNLQEDTLYLYLSATEVTENVKLVFLLGEADKILYLGVDNQWFEIVASGREEPLEKEESPDILRRLKAVQ